MGFDATRKLPGENYHRTWPELLKMTDEAQAIVDALRGRDIALRWPRSGLSRPEGETLSSRTEETRQTQAALYEPPYRQFRLAESCPTIG